MSEEQTTYIPIGSPLASSGATSCKARAAPVVGTIGDCGAQTADSSPDVAWEADFPALGQATASTAIGVSKRTTANLTLPVGAKVTKGDKLFMMEAMKMQTTIYAPADGVVAELHAAVGDTVESKDLIVKLRPAT